MGNIFKQAKSEKRKREILKLEENFKNLSRSQIIHELLPKYVIQPKPKLFHDSTKPDKYIVGGYGSGKTVSFVAEAIFLCFMNRPIPGLLVTQTKGNAIVTTLETLKEMLNDNDLPYSIKEIPTYTSVIIHFGDKDGVLLIASGWDPDSLKGSNTAFTGIDEPFIISKQTYEVAISRARHPKAVINETFFTGTIEPLQMSWGHDIVDDAFTGDDNTFKIVVSTDDNKFATKEYKDRLLRSYDPAMLEVYYHGRFNSLTGDTVYRFDESKNKRPFDTLPDLTKKEYTVQLGLSIDFNVSPMSGVLLWFDEKMRKQIDEFSIENSNTEELCELIDFRLEEKFPGITDENRLQYSLLITADSAARQRKTSAKIGITDAIIIKRFFEQRGYQFHLYIPDVNPSIRDSVNYCNNLFDKGAVIIYDNCKKTLLDLRLTLWKSKLDGFAIDKSKNRSHMSDALRYILYLTQKLFPDEEHELPMIVRGPQRASRM
jgi:hypothetical protein